MSNQSVCVCAKKDVKSELSNNKDNEGRTIFSGLSSNLNSLRQEIERSDNVLWH